MPLWRLACKPRAPAQSGRPGIRVKPISTKHRYGIPSLQTDSCRRIETSPPSVDAADSNFPAHANLASACVFWKKIACSARHDCVASYAKDSKPTPSWTRAHPLAPTPAVELTLKRSPAFLRRTEHPGPAAIPSFRRCRPCIVGPSWAGLNDTQKGNAS